MRRIVVIGGMTAAGKTAAAIELARRFDGELIGADSVQVYRGFDIGSAKPTLVELGSIEHRLLDVLDPNETIDAARYAALADSAIESALAKRKLPIVVGGTGLWLRALLRGLVELPVPDPELRADLDERAEREGVEALHARLASIDPSAALRIHPRDRVRIVRAIEVFEQTGRALGELQREHALGAPRYDALVVVLDQPREALYDAIRARIRGMLDAGWIDETRALLDRWGADVRAMKSVGYREIAQHLREGTPIAEAERLVYKSTRTYTRRQRTWFRGEHPEAWWTTKEAARLRGPSDRGVRRAARLTDCYLACVNFFGHAVVATWHSRDPRLAIGAMLPDLASMAGARLIAAADPIVAAGVALHHATDEVFHGAPSFLRMYTEGIDALESMGVGRGPARAAAHVGVELLLDGLLLDGDAAPVYREAIALASSIDLRWRDGGERFARLRERLAGHDLPVDYRDPSGVLHRLEQTLRRRPRLAIGETDRAPIRQWLEGARVSLSAAMHPLLAEVREGLSGLARR